MLRNASIPFVVMGVASVLIGVTSLVGGSVPVADLAKWTVPIVLLGFGVAGLVRQFAKR